MELTLSPSPSPPHTPHLPAPQLTHTHTLLCMHTLTHTHANTHTLTCHTHTYVHINKHHYLSMWLSSNTQTTRQRNKFRPSSSRLTDCALCDMLSSSVLALIRLTPCSHAPSELTLPSLLPTSPAHTHTHTLPSRSLSLLLLMPVYSAGPVRLAATPNTTLSAICWVLSAPGSST